MATTHVPPLGPIDPDVSIPELAFDMHNMLRIAQGDSDKSSTLDDVSYYDGWVEALQWVLSNVTTNQGATSMAKQEHMAAIENTIDTVEETVQTLERIPKVNLNGTTKNQQVLIISTVAVAGITVGVLANNLIRRGVSKLRRKKQTARLI